MMIMEKVKMKINKEKAIKYFMANGQFTSVEFGLLLCEFIDAINAGLDESEKHQ